MTHPHFRGKDACVTGKTLETESHREVRKKKTKNQQHGMKQLEGAGSQAAWTDPGGWGGGVNWGLLPPPSFPATLTVHSCATLTGPATHVLQRTVLTGIPLLRIKTQNDSMAQEQRSPNHDVPDWPFPAVVNDEVKSHWSQKENKIHQLSSCSPPGLRLRRRLGLTPAVGFHMHPLSWSYTLQVNDASLGKCISYPY